MAKIEPIRLQVVDAIFGSYLAKFEAWDNIGIGVGTDGAHECSRRIWMVFRWSVMRSAPDDPRILRLWQTGHLEEHRLADDLRATGAEVHTVNPDTGKQFKLYFIGGHVRTAIDGAALGIVDAPSTWHLLEFKTSNDKNFGHLVARRVKAQAPGHYLQCQLGMHGTGLTRALYLAVNKNDDDIHGERIEHDPEFCEQQLSRLETIVHASRPPPRLHENPEDKAAWICRFCPAKTVCHDGAFARINCRTCLHSTPQRTGGWWCERHSKKLSVDDQRAGCPNHLYVPDLVPGDQVDAGEDWVKYQLRDGREWVDGAKEIEAPTVPATEEAE